MIVPGSANSLLLAQGASTGYNLTKSLRFRASASAYLNRTPTIAGSQTTWTWSTWIKRGTLSTTQYLFSAGSAISTDVGLFFWTDDTFQFYSRTDGASFATTQVFRDPAAWYHLVFAYDSTQSTSTNRFKVYVNGTQITALGGLTYPSQNATTAINGNGIQYISRRSDGYYFDGYQTETNFIDGQALTPSSFGENNATTGVWQPKKYTGTYGTNGFYLPFTNTTSTSTLGYDFSGNSNNWTTNNFSLTAGSTYDSMTDVPTLTSATTANYCVINSLDAAGSNTISDGNLKTAIGATYGQNRSTVAVTSGKWYWEVTNFSGSYNGVGVCKSDSPIGSVNQTTANGWYYFQDTGNKWNNNTGTAYGASYTSTDVIGVALDMDAGTLTFYKNNTSQGTAFNTGLIGNSLTPTLVSGFNAAGGTFNFGQQPFAYTPPTGYVALNTYNLPTSTIVAGNKYMDATLYTGSGSAQSVVNAAGFKPDLVWGKNRSTGSTSNWLENSITGAGNVLYSDQTVAEQNNTAYATSFNSNGFSVAGNTSYFNASGNSYVGWQWQAGQGTTSSNTNGSITSTVSVNPTAGFSIVTYTGNGTNGATVGHGLGVSPGMIIAKRRDTTSYWPVAHSGLTSGYNLLLPLTNGQSSASGFTSGGIGSFNSTTFTCTQGVSDSANINASGGTYVAYCWAEIAGFSKFGSYTGNGSTDGPFIYTGFRPKFLMTKRTDSATSGDWNLVDTTRNPSNVVGNYLYANQSAAEGNAPIYDILSNGFKIRESGAGTNANGSSYIYIAFAENPFKNALAR